MIVKLTPEEVQDAEQLAIDREKDKLKYKKQTKWKRVGESHRIGAIGEKAVSKILGVDVNREINPTGDAGFDFVVDGETYEVKTTTYNPPYLRFNRMKDFNTDWAVLCHYIDAETINVVGKINKKDFEKKFFWRNFGFGTRVCVDTESMIELE